MKKMVEVRNVSYCYDDISPLTPPALHHITASAGAGEIVGLAGATGSGKSTLAQIIAGLLPADEGQVNLWDLSLKAGKRERPSLLATKVGFVFQNPQQQLFADTVADELSFAPRNLGWAKDKIEQAMPKVLKEVGLDKSFLSRLPTMLSGGEKRRVALASVLIVDAPVLIFDEPLAGLDSRGRREMINLLIKWRAQRQKIVIYISHDMDFLAEYTDRLWLLSHGELLLDLPVAEAFNQRELLRKAGASQPIAAALVYALKKKGHVLPEKLITTQETIEAIKAVCGKGWRRG